MKSSEKMDCGCSALFEDPDFPSDDSSLFLDGSTPISRLQDQITWLRPQEICQTPVFFSDNINLSHAKQGLLGDCWFLCACAVLLKNKHLMDKVFPPDQPLWGDSKYRGSFHFHFWVKGHWIEVIIDDRLPCVDSALCFSHCHAPSAFWVALLEKAYAKLHGSYEQLWAGQVSEALVDLTGGLAESWSLSDFGSEDKLDTPEENYKQRRRKRLDLDTIYPLRTTCALSCSTQSIPGGGSEPDQHHSMTVMEWLEVKTVGGSRVRLFRIRNPWGRCCWGGTWTEGGAGWRSLDPADASDLQARAAQGDFWLDETEFLSRFDDVTLSYPINEEGHLQSIYTGNLLPHCCHIAGRWVKGLSSGGSRNSTSYSSNPKLWLKMSEKGEVLVSLLQHRKWRPYSDGPLKDDTRHQRHQAIGLHMWKVEKKRFNLSRTLNKPPCASTHCHAHQREVVLHGQLEPGHYLMLPSIYQPGAEARFLIRVFSSSSSSLSALRSPAPLLPLNPDGEWETSHLRGSWVERSSAGGSRNFPSHGQNPCFRFTVCDEPVKPSLNVKVTLRQSRTDSDLFPIGFHIYKIPAGEQNHSVPSEDPVASCVPHCYTQDVSLSCSLPLGAYLVVPSTYQPDCAGDFTISLSRRINRIVVKSQEKLGRVIQEVSDAESTNISVMHRAICNMAEQTIQHKRLLSI
ncbi:calpain-10 isoform X2 [Corythoichthys intestinalis]|uniref:calpain-10 isoform X2 n=1 Tax=Corythoichthys intestinalis TaxID=161448 RepID=UPI0025A4F463|nr:calpain-10 isoform X2 [Corythoichthys intestinalis]